MQTELIECPHCGVSFRVDADGYFGLCPICLSIVRIDYDDEDDDDEWYDGENE